MTLFPFTFPKQSVCSERALYFHADTQITYDEKDCTLQLAAGERIAFDTYFNSFPLAQYQRYTALKNVQLALTLSGKATVQLCASRLERGRLQSQVLQEQKTEGAANVTFTLKDFPDESILYPVILAEDDVTVTGGAWKTDCAELRTDVRLSIVICTYRREEFVYRNLAALPDSLADYAHVFVIDNGHTIEADKIKKPFVTVLQNKNLGGSGGFTRGIMETLARKNEFSHVLLMDDDIVFDPMLLYRTRSFLQIVKEDCADYALGGAMLKLERPQEQHENGARCTWWRMYGLYRRLDLTNTVSLLKNMRDEKRQFNGWWYCCMPLACITNESLPMPYFIKFDDIEFGIRLFNEKIIVSNGISVWHPQFTGKITPYLWYYIFRNKLVTNEVIFGALSLPKILIMLSSHILRRVMDCPYSLEFAVQGIKDFFKGPDFLLSTDGEALNASLREKQKELSASHKPFFYYWLSAAWNVVRFSLLFLIKRRTVKSYRVLQNELTSWNNWKARLGL